MSAPNVPIPQNPLANIQLAPYQIYAKEFIKSRPFCGLFFDMGLGKAVEDDLWIPTPAGMRQVGSMLPGNTVFDMNGNVQTIEAVYHHTNIDAYRVHLDDGRSFVCSYEHQIPIATNNFDREIHTVMLKDLLGEELTDKAGHYRFGFPRILPVEFKQVSHKISPDALGVIIAYGEMCENAILFDLSKCPENDKKFAAKEINMLATQLRTKVELAEKDGEYRYKKLTNCDQLIQILKELGYTDKFDFIPDEFRFTSNKDKSHLLMNLLGIVHGSCNHGDRTQAQQDRILRPTFQTPYETLAKNVAELIYSMGFTCKTTYRPRKKIYEINAYLKRLPSDRTRITKIEKLTPRNMTCFTVSGHTHTYLINDYIPTHNTLITLTALFESNPHGHVLVVAPKNIARSTWLTEIKKWKLPIRTKSFVCDGRFKDLTRKKRLQLYADVVTDRPTVYFINRELLVDLIKHMPVINGRQVWYFPHIIIDESQSFKSYKSERFKAIKAVLPCLRSAVILTGTPAPKDLMDLWSQIYILDQGQRLGRTISEYRRTFFRETLFVNGRPVKWEPLPGAEEEIYRRISDIVISAKNTAIQLPAITYNDFTVYMDDDEWDLYKQLAKDAVMDLDCDTQITAANRGVLHNKLSQMASGTIYINDKHEYKIVHKHKVEAVKQIIENSSGSVLIAYYYNSDRDILLDEIDGAVCFDGTPQMMERWNNKEIPVMMIHPASSGHGLNLQFGGHVLIWYSIIDNLEYYLQTNARLYRQGQTDPVIIHHIITDKTVDVPGLPALQAKEDREERLMEAVRIAVDMTDE